MPSIVQLVMGFFDYAQDTPHKAIAGPGTTVTEPAPLPPPVPLAPIAATLKQLNRVRDAMIAEAKQLDAEIRIMAERSRQLTVSSIAIGDTIDKLQADNAATEAYEAVAHADGH